MRILWDAWPRLKRILRRQKEISLFLDFDGTLVPIAASPQSVRMNKAVRKKVGELAALARCRVIIISGRSLQDLRRYFKGLEHVTLVGNHGLEVSGKGAALSNRAKTARKLSALIWLMAAKLKIAFRGLPGVMIEDKTYTLTLHHRNVNRAHRPLFEEKFKAFRKRYALYPLEWRKGKKAWEIRPKTRWNKGDAVLFLLGSRPGAFALVLGDDETDEDMFRAIKGRGVTIRVGRSRKSHADYYIKSVKDTARFLDELRLLFEL